MCKENTREVFAIKCHRCKLFTSNFKVETAKIFFSGKDAGIEIVDFPICPRCGSRIVTEILEEEDVPGSPIKRVQEPPWAGIRQARKAREDSGQD